MRVRFYLTYQGVETEIEEPVGFDNFEVALKRDLKSHGMTFEVSQFDLEFYGVAYDIIKRAYREDGVDAEVDFRVDLSCSDIEEENFYGGRLVFSGYEETDGDYQAIKIPVGQTGPLVLLNNRLDQQVDVDSQYAFDGARLSRAYQNVSRRLFIPGKGVLYTSKAAPPGGDTGEGKGFNFSIADLKIHPFAPIMEGEQSELGEISSTEQGDNYLTWTFNRKTEEAEGVPDEIVNKEGAVFRCAFKVKGSLWVSATNPDTGAGMPGVPVNFQFYIGKVGSAKWGFRNVAGETDEDGGFYADMDFTVGFEDVLKEGDTVRVCVNISYSVDPANPTAARCSGFVNFYKDSFFSIEAEGVQRGSYARTSFIHETLSKLVEIVTNGALTVKSPYYGRPDSEINPEAKSGAGGLRCLTNGLRLRNATLPDKSTPGLFLSLKNLFNDLRAIDNIGMGLDGDKLVVDSWRYFYQEEVLLSFDNIVTELKVLSKEIYATLKIGYKKWGAESFSGVDSLHTEREYRTGVKAVETKLELLASVITDGYTIEETRRKFLEKNMSDWKYDNDVFLFEMSLQDMVYSIRSGLADTDGTVISPETVLNPELTPARNALRWLSYLNQGRRHDTGLKFNAGTGNYSAKGKILFKAGATEPPAISVSVIGENADLDTKSINGVEEAKYPVFLPENIEFSAPLSMQDFVRLRNFPYKSIRINGIRAYLSSVSYKIAEGEAKFIVIPAAEAQ